MNSLCRIQLLGSLRVQQAERTLNRFRTQKAGALLAYLAYYPHQAHPREELLALLWPTLGSDAGRNNLSTELSSLRHQLEPPGVPAGAVLIADRLSVRFNPDAITTDVADFESRLLQSEQAQSEAERAQCLQDVLSLYDGPLLPGYFEEWIRAERERLAEAYLQAVRRLVRSLAEAGEVARALDYAQRAVGIEPLREAVHRDLMRLYVASGQGSLAVQQYRALEALLQQELGESPSAATRRLMREIIAREQTAANAEPPAPTGMRRRAPVQRASSPPRSKTRAAASRTSPPSGTVTFLLIDIVGLAADQTAAETAAPETPVDLDARLLDAVGQHGGHLFKRTADSYKIAFQSAFDALECAVAVQKSIHHRDTETLREEGRDRREEERGNQTAIENRKSKIENRADSSLFPLPSSLNVRMALHTGDVEGESANYHSLVLNQAVRLLTSGHGGQILCSEVTASLLHPDLQREVQVVELGIYRLRDMPEPQRLFQVEYPGMPERTFPLLQAEAGHAANLPLQLTRFFGRESELTRLTQLLLINREPISSTRLVTLTGPGGIGKTRLAIEAARRLVQAFSGAVWFVPLAAVSDARLIPGALLDALRLPHASEREPLDQVVEALCRQPSLVVLDNFEHLVQEGTDLVRILLQRAPTLTCLVTSRQWLELAGEHEFPVPPLPAPLRAGTPEQMSLYESVRLFVDRAQTVKPDFQITANNAEAIADLCVRLEGIPLALELAASRAQVLTPAQMLSQMAHRFDFLVSRRRDADERHRTLWATVDWSYRLLPPHLQRCFARLAVFRGGWSLQATEFVCGAAEGLQVFRSSGVQEKPQSTLGNEVQPTVESNSSQPEYLKTRIPEHLSPDVLDHLAQLRECSLILTEDNGEEMRFRMLETLREYAWDRLIESDDAWAIRAKHCNYFLALAEETAMHLSGAEQGRWLDRLEADHDNLRAALEWCLEEGKREEGRGKRAEEEQSEQSKIQNPKSKIAEGLRLVVALSHFWQVRGHMSEGRVWFERLLSKSEAQASTELRAEACKHAGFLAFYQGDYTAARPLIEESLAIYRKLEIPQGIAGVLNVLGLVVSYQGDYPLARSCYEGSLAINRKLGEKRALAATLGNYGTLARRYRDFALADALLQECLSLRRGIGEQKQIAIALNNLSLVLQDQGDYTTARALLEESLAIRRQLDDPWRIAIALDSMGDLARAEKDNASAHKHYSESLALYRKLGYKQYAARTLRSLAGAACDEDDYPAAYALLTESLQISEEVGYTLGIVSSLDLLALLAVRQQQPARAARLLGAVETLRASLGSSLSPDDLAEHEHAAAAVRAFPDAETWKTAWAAGRSMTSQQAIEYALKAGN